MSTEYGRGRQKVDDLGYSDRIARVERQGIFLNRYSVSGYDTFRQFHRDSLEPLSPVYSREYQDLAPHRLSFSDLEVSLSYRDLFSFGDFA